MRVDVEDDDDDDVDDDEEEEEEEEARRLLAVSLLDDRLFPLLLESLDSLSLDDESEVELLRSFLGFIARDWVRPFDDCIAFDFTVSLDIEC